MTFVVTIGESRSHVWVGTRNIAVRSSTIRCATILATSLGNHSGASASQRCYGWICLGGGTLQHLTPRPRGTSDVREKESRLLHSSSPRSTTTNAASDRLVVFDPPTSPASRDQAPNWTLATSTALSAPGENTCNINNTTLRRPKLGLFSTKNLLSHPCAMRKMKMKRIKRMMHIRTALSNEAHLDRSRTVERELSVQGSTREGG